MRNARLDLAKFCRAAFGQNFALRQIDEKCAARFGQIGCPEAARHLIAYDDQPDLAKSCQNLAKSSRAFLEARLNNLHNLNLMATASAADPQL